MKGGEIVIRASASVRKAAMTVMVAAAALTVFTCAAWAQGPIEGTYKSIDLGGPMNLGRNTVSWSAPGGRLAVDNTVNAESWDGSVLGAQWKIFCTSISSPPVLLWDSVDANGSGAKAWLISHSGGFVWFARGGPWDGGDGPYNGFIDAFTRTTIIHFVDFEVTGAVSTINMEATIVGFVSSCFSLLVANIVELGATGTGTLPLNYPAFLAPDCNETPTLGWWGDITGVTLNVVDCSIIPVEHKTWGGIKQRYED